MAIMLREVHTCLDLSGDLCHASLAERLEQVRVLLRKKQTLMTVNAGNARPVLHFFVGAPLLPRNGFLETRKEYVACLEHALEWQPAPTGDPLERDYAIMALLRVRRALDEEITRRLDNHLEDGKVIPPMK